MWAGMRGRIKNLMLTLDGKQELTLEVDEARAIYDELNGKDLDIALKPHRKNRSLNANAYFHVLVGEIAEKTGQGFEEFIKEFGRNYI